MSTGERDPLLNRSIGERGAPHSLAMHVSSLLDGPKGMRSRVVVSSSDAPWEWHKSGSYRGVTGAEHSTCLSAGIRSLKSQSQHVDMAASLDLHIVAFLRHGVSSRGRPHPCLLTRRETCVRWRWEGSSSTKDGMSLKCWRRGSVNQTELD